MADPPDEAAGIRRPDRPGPGDAPAPRGSAGPAPRGSAGEVFGVFLRLGLTSFGGPVAHLGFFRDAFVTRRRWLSDGDFADLVALAQFLPGPASSQVGLAIGFLRAGAGGALAAFVAFTLPSAVLMIGFALGAGAIGGPIGLGAIAGLKIVAVAIVAQAVWGMAATLCPDRTRATIAVGAVLVTVALAGANGHLAAIALGAVAGLAFCRGPVRAVTGPMAFAVPRGAGIACLALFFGLLFGLPLAAGDGIIAVAEAFYRAGALVFGGGHVLLPLLEASVVRPGWVTADDFLAGYGAAQALPGPLFSFAAYLGVLADPGPGGLIGAVLALLAVFLPGALLLFGVMPVWDAFRALPGAQAVLRGTNAAVVGILGAALHDPVFVNAVTAPPDFALALVCFALMVVWKQPSWVAVLVGAAGGVALALV